MTEDARVSVFSVLSTAAIRLAVGKDATRRMAAASLEKFFIIN
jgi:hypothetical protein